jgi:nuclear transport factor 2 (NTF2) superfamily protein
MEDSFWAMIRERRRMRFILRSVDDACAICRSKNSNWEMQMDGQMIGVDLEFLERKKCVQLSLYQDMTSK